jgi:YnbE-like lipoprotein
MKTRELTNRAAAATSRPMVWLMQTMSRWKRGSRRDAASVLATMVVMSGAAALGGCVTVNAPDKPIVIELNINIEQKVIYQLAADAANTIQDNPEVF